MKILYNKDYKCWLCNDKEVTIRDSVYVCEECARRYDADRMVTLSYRATEITGYISSIKNEIRKDMLRVVRFFKNRKSAIAEKMANLKN